MIDWVMPPQTAATFIFIGWGGLAPQGILYNSKFARTPQFYSDSGPPVRLVRSDRCAVIVSATRHPTGQTVEEHRSDRWHQPDQPCAKFGCEHYLSRRPSCTT
jgi:hypothetical protein